MCCNKNIPSGVIFESFNQKDLCVACHELVIINSIDQARSKLSMQFLGTSRKSLIDYKLLEDNAYDVHIEILSQVYSFGVTFYPISFYEVLNKCLEAHNYYIPSDELPILTRNYISYGWIQMIGNSEINLIVPIV